MKYKDGTNIKVGDKVIISEKYYGVVVADIDGAKRTGTINKEPWGVLEHGIIIDTDFGGLVHYKQSDLAHETITLKRD